MLDVCISFDKKDFPLSQDQRQPILSGFSKLLENEMLPITQKLFLLSLCFLFQTSLCDYFLVDGLGNIKEAKKIVECCLSYLQFKGENRKNESCFDVFHVSERANFQQKNVSNLTQFVESIAFSTKFLYSCDSLAIFRNEERVFENLDWSDLIDGRLIHAFFLNYDNSFKQSIFSKEEIDELFSPFIEIGKKRFESHQPKKEIHPKIHQMKSKEVYSSMNHPPIESNQIKKKIEWIDIPSLSTKNLDIDHLFALGNEYIKNHVSFYTQNPCPSFTISFKKYKEGMNFINKSETKKHRTLCLGNLVTTISFSDKEEYIISVENFNKIKNLKIEEDKKLFMEVLEFQKHNHDSEKRNSLEKLLLKNSDGWIYDWDKDSTSSLKNRVSWIENLEKDLKLFMKNRNSWLEIMKKDLLLNPHDWQKTVIQKIEQGESYLVTVPTGFGNFIFLFKFIALIFFKKGKTHIALSAMYKSLKSGKKLIYICPTQALAKQIYTISYQYFSCLFEDLPLGISLGDLKIKNRRDQWTVLITVPYSLKLKILNDENDLQTIVFDEFHMINDPTDAPTWEFILRAIPTYVNIVALSATLANAEELKKWIFKLNPKWVKNHKNLSIEHRPHKQNIYLQGRNKISFHSSLFDENVKSETIKLPLSEERKKETLSYQEELDKVITYFYFMKNQFKNTVSKEISISNKNNATFLVTPESVIELDKFIRENWVIQKTEETFSPQVQQYLSDFLEKDQSWPSYFETLFSDTFQHFNKSKKVCEWIFKNLEKKSDIQFKKMQVEKIKAALFERFRFSCSTNFSERRYLARKINKKLFEVFQTDTAPSLLSKNFFIWFDFGMMIEYDDSSKLISKQINKFLKERFPSKKKKPQTFSSIDLISIYFYSLKAQKSKTLQKISKSKNIYLQIFHLLLQQNRENQQKDQNRENQQKDQNRELIFKLLELSKDYQSVKEFKTLYDCFHSFFTPFQVSYLRESLSFVYHRILNGKVKQIELADNLWRGGFESIIRKESKSLTKNKKFQDLFEEIYYNTKLRNLRIFNKDEKNLIKILYQHLSSNPNDSTKKEVVDFFGSMLLFIEHSESFSQKLYFYHLLVENQVFFKMKECMKDQYPEFLLLLFEKLSEDSSFENFFDCFSMIAKNKLRIAKNKLSDFENKISHIITSHPFYDPKSENLNVMKQMLLENARVFDNSFSEEIQFKRTLLSTFDQWYFSGELIASLYDKLKVFNIYEESIQLILDLLRNENSLYQIKISKILQILELVEYSQSVQPCDPQYLSELAKNSKLEENLFGFISEKDVNSESILIRSFFVFKLYQNKELPLLENKDTLIFERHRHMRWHATNTLQTTNMMDSSKTRQHVRSLFRQLKKDNDLPLIIFSNSIRQCENIVFDLLGEMHFLEKERIQFIQKEIQFLKKYYSHEYQDASLFSLLEKGIAIHHRSLPNSWKTCILLIF